MKKYLISSKDLSQTEIFEIFRLANLFQEQGADFSKELSGFLISTLFCENSTRTKASFELAAKNLGAKILDLNLATSSANKGESLQDTIRTLISLGVDLLIIRERFSGIAKFLEEEQFDLSVINAGDGKNEHPSQALLDLYTIYREFNRELKPRKILIVGDCSHSRVVKSNLYLLKLFGFQVYLAGPVGFIQEEFVKLGVDRIFYNLKEALKIKPDLIMCLRVQKERQSLNLSLKEYAESFCLSKKLLLANKIKLEEIRILHPGPVNRNIEISSELINHPNSLINKQVQNGLYLRMAILKYLLNNCTKLLNL